MPASGPSTIKWLRTRCSNLDLHFDRPTPLKSEIVHIGKQSSHPTHQLFPFRGLVFCRKCGYRGPTFMVNSARRCEPPGQQGLRNIKALLNGQLPHGLDQWPDSNTPGHHATFAQAVINDTANLTAEESETLHAFLSTSFKHELSHVAHSDISIQQVPLEPQSPILRQEVCSQSGGSSSD